jgi:8-oxo-dGTP pyrophosphatase MutT (NUDIX family)
VPTNSWSGVGRARRSRARHFCAPVGYSERLSDARLGLRPEEESAPLGEDTQERGVPRGAGTRPPDRKELQLRLRGTCPAGEDEQTTRTPGIPAAVLIGLLARAEGPHIILTERAAHLKDHAAQISLPGGRVEAADDGPAAAALREAFEEIGLPPDRVEILGCLSPYETVTGFRVYPFVGWIERPVEFTPDEHEVVDVFEIPLSFVLDPANHHREGILRDGKPHSFYVLPYPGRRIWGATAAILVDLARVLTP